MKKVNKPLSTGLCTTKTSIFDYGVECPHKDECRSYPYRCDTCRHNSNKKKDYYEREPDDYPWRRGPYVWYDWYSPGNETSVKYG
jgi:hypothetical protein